MDIVLLYAQHTITHQSTQDNLSYFILYTTAQKLYTTLYRKFI